MLKPANLEFLLKSDEDSLIIKQLYENFHRIEFSLFARLSSFYLRRLFQALTLSST